jgi:predicted dinucleotide-binding enzyme
MTTAIIGVGNIGGALARHLVRGGEHVTLAAREESNASALAGELGRPSSRPARHEKYRADRRISPRAEPSRRRMLSRADAAW